MYKKHKIVILASNTPAERVGNILLYSKHETSKNDKDYIEPVGNLLYGLEEVNIPYNMTALTKTDQGIYWNGELEPQHLYILSDDDLIKGDWCYNISSQTMFKADKELIELINDPDVTLTTNKKIIATTNKSLHLVCDGQCGSECVCTLPSIPEYFIKYFIKQYNTGNIIQEVDVLRDEFDDIEISSGSTDEIIININISNKNYFQFEAALQVEKVYSRTEVISILEQYHNKFAIPTMGFPSTPIQDWIEQNLK